MTSIIIQHLFTKFIIIIFLEYYNLISNQIINIIVSNFVVFFILFFVNCVDLWYFNVKLCYKNIQEFINIKIFDINYFSIGYYLYFSLLFLL